LNTHEHYEELCALAASGQASAEDLRELNSHLEDCPSCRRATSDFAQIIAQGLGPLAAKRSRSEIPSGMTERFAARVGAEGIEISREALSRATTTGRRAVFAGVVAAIAAVILIATLLTTSRRKSIPVVETREQQPAQQRAVQPSPGISPQNTQAKETRFQQQLVSARAEMASMETAIRNLRAELESVNKARSSLNSRLTDAKQENERIQSERAQWGARLAQLEADVEKSRSEKSVSDAALALQETELRELQKKMSDESEALQQQEALAARGADIRDLVVARNLHIIDVHDRDGDGKSQRAFGRIFYTEGKSLIFYAYDLTDPRKLDAKVSFYVWGECLGAEKPIRSLGVFHNDDANDGRWVLTFDDPQVLAQINSVFVTVESSKKLTKEPRGRRILFAFLGDKPNHP
jgi:anti-sigma factor RsiW